MKYLKSVREKFEKRPAFRSRDLRVFLKPKGISGGYLKQLVHNLVKNGEVHRLSRGTYTFQDDTQVIGQAYQPCYHGLQEALSIHGLWEQETNPVIITTRKVRTGLRQFLGSNYLVRRIGRKMFFGFGTVKYGGRWIPVSNVEKTLIDFAYYNEPLDAATRKEILNRIRKPVLAEYIKRCGGSTGKKVEKLIRTGRRHVQKAQ